MQSRKKLGVVLFQLGGPDSLDAVEPFLYNLFCDPEIINFMGAGLARKPLARFIAHRRSEIVREHYAAIGGRSPISELTNRQARALAAALEPYCDATVVVAMRYWHPLTQEAIKQLQGIALDQLILLPLYPHYSFATTGSSLKEWQRLYRSDGTPVRMVNDFHEHPLYISAIVERVNEALQPLARREEVHLVFSAHGLPMSLVDKGDPYPKQIETTVRLVREQGGWKNPRILCYQSRVGRQKWLEPSLTQTIETLAKSGVRRMLVIPISFVTEHIETLHEINIEAREEAEALGVEEFYMTAALDDSPAFVRALADLVRQASGLPGIS
ncbi:MAG TPA: ferrochelatase [Candidatus Limnocylindrales bacterium]|nr:ferrochelatase [Candidatus Limnocylindrales bacterium]